MFSRFSLWTTSRTRNGCGATTNGVIDTFAADASLPFSFSERARIRRSMNTYQRELVIRETRSHIGLAVFFYSRIELIWVPIYLLAL